MSSSNRRDFIPMPFREWAREQSGWLDLVLAGFESTGVWPTINDLTRELVRRGQPTPVREIAWKMPRPLGYVDTNPERIVLSLFCLYLRSGDRLIDSFVRVLSLARDRYAADDESPKITRADVVAIADESETNRRALEDVVLREAPFFDGGSGGPGDDWTRDVGAAIVRYWDVDIDDSESYLELRAHELEGNPQLGWPAPVAQAESRSATPPRDSDVARDVFISHASEDKAAVAKPIAVALDSAGWSVWLDEYELTVGDRLTQSINAGLASSRFGVVVLSPAFFDKHWPKEELEALAAKEAASGSKVILPVWHRIDQDYLAEVAPMLAGRLGVSTDRGLPHVAQELIRALARERRAPVDPEQTEPIVRSVESSAPPDLQVARVPKTPEERDQLLETRPVLWEYLLFAGELFIGRQALEQLWYDHELRVGRGERRYLDLSQASTHLTQSIRALSMAASQMVRPLTPENQERAFGAPGEPGDPLRIQQAARLIVGGYESLMQTAAELRALVVPDEYEHAYELVAQFADRPLQQVRDFIDRAVTETERASEHVVREPEGEPLRIVLDLTLTIDDDVQARLSEELERIGDELSGDSS